MALDDEDIVSLEPVLELLFLSGRATVVWLVDAVVALAVLTGEVMADGGARDAILERLALLRTSALGSQSGRRSMSSATVVAFSFPARWMWGWRQVGKYNSLGRRNAEPCGWRSGLFANRNIPYAACHQ